MTAREPAPGFADVGYVDDYLGYATLDALPADAVRVNRAAWVAALRSGDYAQGQQALRTGEPGTDEPSGYCCLGVAEDVGRGGADWRFVIADDVDDDVDDDDVPEPGWGVLDDQLVIRLASPVVVGSGDLAGPLDELRLGASRTESSTLTTRCRRWLGVWDADPKVVVRARDVDRWEVSGLVALNDDRRLSLAQIADVIDDQPPDWDGTPRFARREADRRNDAEVEATP